MDLRQACFQDAAAAARTRALFASALARTLAARSETPSGPACESDAPALFRLRRLAFNLCDPTDLPDEAALLLLDAGMREEVALAAGLHASRLDGSPLVYNGPETSLPDLLICRPEFAEAALRVVHARTRG